MGVFGGGSPKAYAGESATLGSLQPCKPEYEKMIASVQGQKKASKDLYDALLHYIDNNGGAYDTASQILIGGLIVEMRDQDKTIARLIAQQEAEK